MDRRLSMEIIVIFLLLVGCSKSPPDAATAPSPDNAAAPAASSAPLASPPLASAPVPTEPAATAPAEPQADFSKAPELQVFPQAPKTAELAQPRRLPGLSESNPLRLDFEAPTATAENPLRSRFAAEPRTATSPPIDAPAAPSAAPSGGSARSFEPLASAPDIPPLPAAAVPQRGGPSAASNQAFDVVQVFYGTDRQSTEPTAGDWPRWLARFVPTGAALLVTLCVGLAAVARRSFAISLVAMAGLACTGGLGLQASASTLASLRRLGTTGPRYTTARAASGQVDLGICEVSIPRSHDPGEVESPSITRLEILPDAVKHVVLRKTERLEDERFHELLRQRVVASDRKEVFVFIHGFNVSFEDAARRTAQIHHDLKFPGAPVFFSWPANDKFVFTYLADATNVGWSVPHLKKFLLEIVEHSEAQSINLIAHSMGNRALAAALREIDLEFRGQARLFNQVILAAPDIDAEDFRHNIAPAMRRTARQMTLYASSRDDALLASQLVHRGPRAGDAGAGLVVVQGVDTIDVTAIDSSPWGHSYYGSSDPVLHDLQELFARAVPPRDRSWLSPAQRDGLTYWVFQATRTAAAGEGTNR